MIYSAENKPRHVQRALRSVDYRIWEWGDEGQPLLFYLHGWGDCAASFQFVVDKFSRDWHVVAPDWRGFGGSRGLADAYWFPDYLADLDELLHHYSPNDAVRLIGHSMGANIGGLYAGAMPERVSAFANLEGFGLSDSNPDDAPQHYRRWLEALRGSTGFKTFPDFAALEQRIRKRSPRMPDDKVAFVARAWASEEAGEIVLHADPLHRLPNAVLYRRAESEACWRAVTASVLLVAGSESAFANDERIGATVDTLPFARASVELIENAGHMMHFEAPGTLARVLEAFFTKHL